MFIYNEILPSPKKIVEGSPRLPVNHVLIQCELLFPPV